MGWLFMRRPVRSKVLAVEKVLAAAVIQDAFVNVAAAVGAVLVKVVFAIAAVAVARGDAADGAALRVRLNWADKPPRVRRRLRGMEMRDRELAPGRERRRLAEPAQRLV